MRARITFGSKSEVRGVAEQSATPSASGTRRTAPPLAGPLAQLPQRRSEQARASIDSGKPENKRARADQSSPVSTGDAPLKRPRTGTLAGPLQGSRQSVTAAMVYTILLNRARNVRPADIVRAHSIALSTVNMWVSEKRWRSDNLVGRLAKLPDYETYRTSLDELAKQLVLTADDLPPPAKPRQKMDAAKLKTALELLIDKQAIRGAGYGKGPNVLEMVGDEVGCQIWHWLKADGGLRKPEGAVARLAGYDDLKDDLRDLFRRMGHVETAQRLPQTGENSVIRVSTRLLADALSMLAADRAKPLREIGAALRVETSLLANYIGREDGKLRDVSGVQKLPDYGENREALAGALSLLGHTAQADNLPLAPVDAVGFLKTLRTSLVQFATAIAAMRSNPTLSTHEAANGAGLPPAALSAVVGPDGVMRERAKIHALLKGLKPYLVPGIDEQLDRLEAGAEGHPLASASAPLMATIEFPARGSIPAKVFVVRSTTRDPGSGTLNRLQNIYADNPELVRAPRSFDSERPRQVLRWLSTVLRKAFPLSREIQCYYDVKGKEILVSSNVTSVNQQLASILPRGGLLEIIEGRCDVAHVRDSREARHLEKLIVSLSADPVPVRPRLLDDVLMAMKRAKFHVPQQNFNERGKHVHLHAERRIKEELQRNRGARVDSRLLAGTMRPCGSCADDLKLDDAERRGPFWLSQPAGAFVDVPRIIERNQARAIGTYVTQTRAGKITTDYDTDSDTDVDTEAVPPRR
ncbi:hypothetical protein [Paraburkholderia phosphatilytica]|uniref:hypothetical protein n=1 Tax=Paraburkholderia phosphatilytica TaxID=2282883 RepID=UPI000F5E9ADF|nr:hypothetical protein [Paraburkholderia phosphatilytica]